MSANQQMFPLPVWLQAIGDAITGKNKTDATAGATPPAPWLDQLAAQNNQKKYDYLREQGVPLDDPQMLALNPALASFLQQNAAPEPTYEQLIAQGVPLDDPKMLAMNPTMAAILQEYAPQAGPMDMAQIAHQLASRPQQAAPVDPAQIAHQLASIPQQPAPVDPAQIWHQLASIPQQASPMDPAQIAHQLASLQAPAPQVNGPVDPEQIAHQLASLGQSAPAPVAPQSAPVASLPQQRPMVEAAPHSPPPVQSQMPMQQGQQLPPTPQSVPEALAQTDMPWYRNEQGMAWLADVLAGAALGPNVWQGAVTGGQAFQQRQAQAQTQSQESMLTKAQLAKLDADTKKTLAETSNAEKLAKAVSDPNNPDARKREAEISKLAAETALAKARAANVGKERAFNDADYANVYADVLKAENDAAMVGGKDYVASNPFGTDFAARLKLNTISPNVARFYPMDGKTKAVLDESRRAWQAGEITKEEFDSRLYQVQFVHGPESVRKYLSGASNETTKP